MIEGQLVLARPRTRRLADDYTEWMVERVPADKQLAGQLERWRTMNLRGWDITALLAPDSKTVVAVGCR